MALSDSSAAHVRAGLPSQVEALRYKFPVWPVADGACTCKDGATCPRPGKHARVLWGSYAPGWSPAAAENYGVRTGAVNGIFVVDCDGDAVQKEFEARLESTNEPIGFSVATGRADGGAHFYFRHPGGDFRVTTGADVLGKGIDVRGDGGMVVGPGSMHKSGARYAMADDEPIYDAPAWLLAEVKDERERGEGDVQPIGEDHPHRAARIAAFEEKCRAGVDADGQDNMFRLAQYGVRLYELDDETVYDTIVRLYNSRCTPPWSPSEIDHKIADARVSGYVAVGLGEDFCAALHHAALEQKLARIDDHNAKALADVVARQEEAARNPRKRPSKDHVYTYAIGMQAMSDPARADLSEVINWLCQLRKEWRGVLQFNEFEQRIYAVDPPMRLDAEGGQLTDADVTRMRAWFAAQGKSVTKDNAWDAVQAAARAVTYHPVREYLDALPLEGCPGILDDLATRIFGAELPIENEYLRKFVIGAVRRAQVPGVKMDTMLTLQGAQGARKSSFVAALFGGDWTRDLQERLDHKDAALSLAGSWAIELPELDSVGKSRTEATKAFLSRTIDRVRSPYGRAHVDLPRQCVFVGSTNAPDFLHDETGNRRFWPIQVTKRADLDFVHEHRDAIWSEAARLARLGEAHWFEVEGGEDAKEALERFEAPEHPWTERAREQLLGVKFAPRLIDLYAQMFPDADVSKFGVKEARDLGGVLRKLGCDDKPRMYDGKKERRWIVPAELADATPTRARVAGLPGHVTTGGPLAGAGFFTQNKQRVAA